MFHAVEIDGEAYWDGGYMGNPALFPLIYNCKSSDIVIVHINPLFRKELPYAAVDILNRINEISFNSSLMREMRAVSFITGLVKQNRIVGEDIRQIFIHSVADDEFMGALSPTSKYNADWDFLVFLRDQGRKCANDWLASHFVKLGVEIVGQYRRSVSLDLQWCRRWRAIRYLLVNYSSRCAMTAATPPPDPPRHDPTHHHTLASPHRASAAR